MWKAVLEFTLVPVLVHDFKAVAIFAQEGLHVFPSHVRAGHVSCPTFWEKNKINSNCLSTPDQMEDEAAWGVQEQRGGTAAAAAELGAALARLGLKSVEDLSVDNLEDLGAGHALEQQLECLGSELVATLSFAVVLAEKFRALPATSTDAQNLVWRVLKEHEVEPQALSAFVYHVTKVHRPSLKTNSKPSHKIFN
jgi:hypothetical protein